MTTTQKIFLCRYCERADLADTSWYGEVKFLRVAPVDPPLTARGIRQARDVATEIKESGAKEVFCSPFARCVKTAQIVSEAISESSGHPVGVKVVQALSECISADLYPTGNPLRMLYPDVNVAGKLNAKIEEVEDIRITPKYPETLPQMAKRCKQVIKQLLDSRHEAAIVIVTHSLVIETMAPLLVPSLAFPKGITFGSLTEINILRDKTTDNFEGAHLVRAADDSFLQYPEYESGPCQLRFSERLCMEKPLLGGCCSFEVDEWEEQFQVSKELVATLEAEANRVRMKSQGFFEAILDLSPFSKHKTPQLTTPEREFLAFSNNKPKISISSAVQLAYYYGFAPSNADLHHYKTKYGNALDFYAFNQFLRDVEHPEDTVDTLSRFFAHFDPSNSGTISRLSFRNFLTAFGEPITEEEADKICMLFGEKENRINYRQFAKQVLLKPTTEAIDTSHVDTRVALANREIVEPAGELSPGLCKSPVEMLDEKSFFGMSNKSPRVIATQPSQEARMAFAGAGGSLPLAEAVKIAKSMGEVVHARDVSDFQLINGDDVTYEGFCNLLEFLGERRQAFSEISGGDAAIPIEKAIELASIMRLRNAISSKDIEHYRSRVGDCVRYAEFLKLCEFVEQRQSAFASFANTLGEESKIPTAKSGVLANRFGFAPSKDDIQQLMKRKGDTIDYPAFLQFLDGCVHKEDSVECMQQFFATYDETGSGFVSQKVFRNVLFMFGESHTSEQIGIIVNDLANNDDPINYVEFINRVLTPVEGDCAIDPMRLRKD